MKRVILIKARRRKFSNKKGSVLVLFLVIIGAATALGLTSLNIAMSQLQIKKTNSEVKEALYLSEGGLNNTYLRVYDLVVEAAEDSLEKAEDYILEYPDKSSQAPNIFYSNYRSFVTGKVTSSVKSSITPYVKIISEPISFINNKLTFKINSRYITESSIEVITTVDITLLVPDYLKTKNHEVDFKELIVFNNYNL